MENAAKARAARLKAIADANKVSVLSKLWFRSHLVDLSLMMINPTSHPGCSSWIREET